MNELSIHTGYEPVCLAPDDRLKVANQSLALIEALRLAIDYPDMVLQSDHTGYLFDQLGESIADLYATIETLSNTQGASHE